MHRHEWPRAATAETMNGSRDQFLARTALARDEHTRLRTGNQGNLLEDLLQRGGPTDDLILQSRRRSRFARAATAPPQLQRAIEHSFGDGQIERLREVFKGSVPN